MASNRKYVFNNTVIENIYFQPVLDSGDVRTDFNFLPEINDENEQQVRIFCEIKITNEDVEQEILDLQTYSYFLVSENFGEFNLDNQEEKDMVHDAFQDIKFFMLSIIRETDMRYLDLDFQLDIERVDNHENK